MTILEATGTAPARVMRWANGFETKTADSRWNAGVLDSWTATTRPNVSLRPVTASRVGVLRKALDEMARRPPVGSGRLRSVHVELRALALLPAGWDGRHGEAPSSGAIRRAEIALFELAENDLIPTWVRPNPDGGVVFGFASQQTVGVLEFTDDGDTVLGFSGSHGITVREISLPLAADVMRELRERVG